MSLHIESIRLHDFRSYHDAKLEGLSDLVIFTGPNATGKTNLVEAMQLLTALDTFRNAKTVQLIRWGCEGASASAVMVDGARRIEAGLVLDARGRHYRLNGKQRPRQELQGVLPSVLFSPDDLQLVKGPPEGRRAALDALGSQVSRNYLSVRRDYERLLRQKNRLLKEDMPPAYLASVNEVLVRIGGQLLRYRLHLLRVLADIFPSVHARTTASPDEAALAYVPSFQDVPLSVDEMAMLESDRDEVEDRLHRALEGRQGEEFRRMTSLVGPHRDKLAFLLNGRPAADYASQGQQRSIVIAYKLAEMKLIERLMGVKPVLLLDDVMSELDTSRRETLVFNLAGAAQTFITTTNLGYFTAPLLERAQVVELPLEPAE